MVQQCLGRCYKSMQHPFPWQDPKFLSRSLPKASHTEFFLRSVPRVSDANVLAILLIYQTKPHSSIALWTSSDAHVGSLGSVQESTLAP